MYIIKLKLTGTPACMKREGGISVLVWNCREKAEKAMIEWGDKETAEVMEWDENEQEIFRKISRKTQEQIHLLLQDPRSE